MTHISMSPGFGPVVDAVQEFNKSSSELSKQMIDAIERFEKSSSNLGNKMLLLTLAIGFMSLVMILLMIIQIQKC